jgi:monoamine oxidase
VNRRKFLEQSFLFTSTTGLLHQCSLANGHIIRGSINGADKNTGHILRDGLKSAAASKKNIETDVIIIGGGISGLSAARWLYKNGKQNFILVEMASQTGGNAAGGKNEVSAYPLGAHYIPLPNNKLEDYTSFLQDCNVITGYENGLPVINEYFLCFEPQERLYINGYWQDGIIPHFGTTDEDNNEVKRFLKQMEDFRNAKGSDGKDAFTIPVAISSSDSAFTRLDSLTMKEWMLQQNYVSKYLHWYVNYCCRDDFGADYSVASAWAGIHYFAGRKGKAGNAPAQSVITWPQGNAWLAAQLRKDINEQILTNHIAVNIQPQVNSVIVQLLNVTANTVTTVTAKKCIVAIPQFAGMYLLPNSEERRKMVKKNFVYQPWMVANITAAAMEQRNGAALSWDNVIYNGNGLGYVNAGQQLLQQGIKKNVLTYYLPLTASTATEERMLADKRSFEDWVQLIKKDFEMPHPDFETKTERIDIWVWGHGMISPGVNFIHGNVRKQLQQPINNQIFFSHTDLAGISIFEEAFYQGINAAKEVIAVL